MDLGRTWVIVYKRYVQTHIQTLIKLTSLPCTWALKVWRCRDCPRWFSKLTGTIYCEFVGAPVKVGRTKMANPIILMRHISIVFIYWIVWLKYQCSKQSFLAFFLTNLVEKWWRIREKPIFGERRSLTSHVDENTLFHFVNATRK